jgi:hypothetical protein
MTDKDFRRIALGMKGAVESAHLGHPDFRANGRIFATLHGDLKSAMVKLTPDQQKQFMADVPGVFKPESGAWGLQGCTAVLLAKADEEIVGEALTLAWRNSAVKSAQKKRMV